MDVQKQNTLKAAIPDLVKLIPKAQVEEVATCLCSEFVITDNMLDTILSNPKHLTRVRTLIDILRTREADAFDKFYKILVTCGLETAADFLRPELKQKRISDQQNRKPHVQEQTEDMKRLRIHGGAHNIPEQPTSDSDELPTEWPIQERCNKDYVDRLSVEQCKPEDRNFQRSKDGQSNEIYKMSTKRRGYVLVINNKNFSPTNVREGTEIDAKAIDKLFTQLGFDVEIKSDCTAQDMKDSLKEYSSKPDLKTMDCFICFILTHGSAGGVHGVDDNPVKRETLYSLVDGENCPALFDKPKLFFIQACRTDQPYTNEVADSTPGNNIPTKLHFFMSLSTIPEQEAFRSSDYGSRFIFTWIYVIERFANRCDLMDLATKVNSLMAKFVNMAGVVQTSETTTRLEKKVYFFPGLFEE